MIRILGSNSNTILCLWANSSPKKKKYINKYKLQNNYFLSRILFIFSIHIIKYYFSRYGLYKNLYI